jgi:hypothetical protein
LLALAIAAFLTLIAGMIAEGVESGWIQGVAIFFAIFIIVSI